MAITKDKFQLDQFLPYHFVVAADLMSRSLSRVYASYSLTIPEWRILAQLHEHCSLTHQQLCKLTSMEKARVTRALILMDKKKLITKRQDTTDQRIYHIRLKMNGEKLFTKIEPDITKWHHQLSEVLGGDTYQKLLAALIKIETLYRDD